LARGARGRARRRAARRALRPARDRDPLRPGGRQGRLPRRDSLDRGDRADPAPAPRGRSARGGRGHRGRMKLLPVLAQLQIHSRSGQGCIESDGFCPHWIVDNFSRYVHPFWEHVYLTLISVAIGFIIAFALALLAHRRRWLTGPIVGFTGLLYTIPSIALFLLLLPITGRGNTTAIVALVSYTLLIIFRNITTGLNNVPEEMKDAGRGMGLTENQLLWKIELPL